ncbi:hypothetical protein CC78DRAFT_586026 [Lojkania enalia]|uniref:Nicotianamine synthase n=1 Tax=Lojkania enalia TaxID=147567 RepID=A0A9P4MZC5_9PLEO|nr:hypothetical protein CC78DRAFT_586026 [Didymosphaeria enalia]
MSDNPSRVQEHKLNGSEGLISEILKLTEELSNFSSFEPSPGLNNVLNSISHLCHRTDVSPILEDQILNDASIITILPILRDLWAKSAGALEDSWARRILASGSPHQAQELLDTYPRLGNYKATIPIELGLISIAYGSFPSSIAMLGSGPLPLTSLSIVDSAAEKGQAVRILNIDMVPERIRDSKQIFNLLGDKYRCVSHQISDATGGLPDLSGYDAVYVASLVGNSDGEKVQILKNTARHMRKGAVIVVRSSTGLSRLLWPSFQADGGGDQACIGWPTA